VEKEVIVNRALRCLPVRHRRAIELRLKKGWTQATIARELGVSQMHVSRLIREAVDIMRDMCSVQEETA
jgi:RNA polymerase sigma-B factor